MKPGKQLSEPHVLIANQKKHINSLNRIIWLLLQKAGGEVRLTRSEMALAEGWKFSVFPDEQNSDVTIFQSTTDAPNNSEKALTA